MGKKSKDVHETHQKEEAIEIKKNEVGASMLVPTLIMAVGLIVIGLLNAIIVKGIIAYIIPVGMKWNYKLQIPNYKQITNYKLQIANPMARGAYY